MPPRGVLDSFTWKKWLQSAMDRSRAATAAGNGVLDSLVIESSRAAQQQSNRVVELIGRIWFQKTREWVIDQKPLHVRVSDRAGHHNGPPNKLWTEFRDLQKYVDPTGPRYSDVEKGQIPPAPFKNPYDLLSVVIDVRPDAEEIEL